MTDKWLDRQLADLSDERAIQILKSLSDDRAGGAGQIGAPEFASELERATGVSSGASGAVADADLARATLRLLAADGAYEDQFRAFLGDPHPEAFLELRTSYVAASLARVCAAMGTSRWCGDDPVRANFA